MITAILFIAGFIILIKGADLLVTGSSSVAKKFRISNLVIGLTVVAFGTSAPELFVNIFASFQGNTEIAIGNILGSNIANILLILGVSASIYPLAVQSTTVWKEIPFSLLAAVVVGILANDMLIDGKGYADLSRGDGLVLLGFFAIFMYYIFEISKKTDADKQEDYRQLSNTKSVIYILTGISGLVLGGKWIVDGAVEGARIYGISEAVIGLTVIAIGTSLPELATSAVAAYRKNTDIAIGNVVGSNIFNIFWVLGLSAFIKPLPFRETSNEAIMVTVICSALLFLFLFVGKRNMLERWQGIMFVAAYIIYTIHLLTSV